MLASGAAHAGIVGSTANVQDLGTSVPTDLTTGAVESTEFISVFTEQQDLTLTEDLYVDLMGPGYFDHESQFWNPGTIDAGTNIDVYLLHLDNDETLAPVTILTGTMTFDKPIVGVLWESTTLHATDDMLGVPGVEYSDANRRGLELGSDNDWLDISPDGMSVTVNMRVPAGMDELRVITSQPLPAPGALAVLAGGLFASGRRRRQ
jgi:hypothetical protein